MPVKRDVKKEDKCCDYVHKKQLLGCFLFLVGFLWYANETELFGPKLENFWPYMLMLIGAIVFFKTFFIKYKR